MVTDKHYDDDDDGGGGGGDNDDDNDDDDDDLTISRLDFVSVNIRRYSRSLRRIIVLV